jgi:rhodanese-related sulfurtransferase
MDLMSGGKSGSAPRQQRDAASAEDPAAGRHLDCPTDAELVAPHEVERLRGDGVGVIDLRSPQAYAAGRLPGAINVPADALVERPTQARGAVILYDDDGSLVARRCGELRQAVGELEFFVLAGGLRAWIDAGLPVEER